MLLIEKNATINIVEEVDNEDSNQNANHTNEVNIKHLIKISLKKKLKFAPKRTRIQLIQIQPQQII